MALILALAAVFIFRPAPPSYAVTPDGRLIKLIPINEGVGKEAIIDFTSRAIINCFSIDFLNWEKQLASLAPLFTDKGYNSFMEAIRPFKERVVQGRYVTLVGLASPPMIIKTGLIKGVMKYRLQTEIVISFEGQTKRVPPQKWEVETIIERVPMSRSPIGIQISSLIAEPASNLK